MRIDGSPAPALKVAQPLATIGGADAETIAGAQRRIPSYLRHRERAVTAEDYKALAFETPGVDVGRVDVLPRFKPHDRRFGVPGRGLGDGAAGPGAVGPAEPAPRSAVHRAPARAPVGADAARHRALRDRLRVRAARPRDGRHDSRRTRPRRDALRRARGAEAAAVAAAAGRHRRRRLAARPRRARARDRGRDLARGRRPRGRRASTCSSAPTASTAPSGGCCRATPPIPRSR